MVLTLRLPEYKVYTGPWLEALETIDFHLWKLLQDDVRNREHIIHIVDAMTDLHEEFRAIIVDRNNRASAAEAWTNRMYTAAHAAGVVVDLDRTTGWFARLVGRFYTWMVKAR